MSLFKRNNGTAWILFQALNVIEKASTFLSMCKKGINKNTELHGKFKMEIL